MVSANVNSISGNIVESYTYDYLGNRTSKTTDGEITYFTMDLSTGYSQVLKTETGTETVYYTRGFELISRRVGTDASYYLYDGGMSVRALTDESGVVTDTFVFDAFGNEVARTGSSDNSYGFQGEERDATGLYYLRARYMDSSTGTFTSMDTYGGSLSDPMSLHKYLFANSNPVKYCDPSGHAPLTLEDTMGTVAIITVLASVSSAWIYSMLGDIYGVDKTEPSYWVGMIVTVVLAAILAYFVAGAFVAGVTLCFTGKVLLVIMGFLTGAKCIKLSNIARMNGFDAYADLFEFVGVVLQTYALIELWEAIYEGFDSIRDALNGSSSNSFNNNGTSTNGSTSFSSTNPAVEEDYSPGEYLAGDAPYQVTPGIRTLEGVHTTESGTPQPWVAYYDEYGRLIARTDYNAPNPAAGIPSTHYHIYNWTDGNPYRDPNHYPGEYQS
jgi:RHS repeat-associated protein